VKYLYVGIGVRKPGFGLPSLRTVRAVLPHTALQLMVLPQRGLTDQRTRAHQTEQPVRGKVGVGPTTIVHAVTRFTATLAPFPKDRTQSLTREGVQTRKHPRSAMPKVDEPAAQGNVHVRDRARQAPSRLRRRLVPKGRLGHGGTSDVGHRPATSPDRLEAVLLC